MTRATFVLSDESLEQIARRLAELLNNRPGNEPWIGVPEAAEYIGAKPQRVYDLVSQGRIPHGKDGSRLVFRRSELDRYLHSLR